MREMLGNNEYGLITQNNEEELYQGIKNLMNDSTLLTYYRKQAAIRGKMFSTQNTVHDVERMLYAL